MSQLRAVSIQDTVMPTLSVEALERIFHAHAAYAAHQIGGTRAVLRGHDLTGAQLSRHVLSGADFTGSILRSANLSFANCAGTELYCADLQRIDGRFCNFSRADLRGAKLNGSNLTRATLDNADFRPGRLVRQLANGRPEYIDRSGSGTNVDFSLCALHDANFEGAYLQGASFRGAIIHATKFKYARLNDVDFSGAVLSEVNLDELRLPDSVLKTCVLAPPVQSAMATRYRLAVLLEAHQRWIESDGRTDVAAVLDGEDLRPIGGAIAKYRLTAASAQRVIGVAMNFSGMELQGVNFAGADLRGAVFDNADLRGANFRGARLGQARFSNTDMRSLLIKTGQRMDLDLFGAELNDDQLTEARIK